MWSYLGRGKGTKRGMGLGPSGERLPVSGVSKLSSEITINSITETAVWRYEAKDINGTSWPGVIGPTLSESGTGSSPVVSIATEFDDGTKEAAFQAGKYFTVADDALHDVATEDFVLEVVTRFGGTNSYLLAKGTNPGWRLRESTTTTYTNIGGSANGSIGTTAGVLYHNIIFFDRSGSLGYYKDGVGTAVVSISAQSGDQSNASNFSIGADSGGTFPTTGSIIMAQAWKRSAWLNTHIQTTVASSRNSLLRGT